jgi:hypothetical protein
LDYNGGTAEEPQGIIDGVNHASSNRRFGPLSNKIEKTEFGSPEPSLWTLLSNEFIKENRQFGSECGRIRFQQTEL